jgi:hypothetical protein
MSPINFCKATRKRFVQDLKRAQREIIAERARKDRDEVKRVIQRESTSVLENLQVKP